mmetsp:Transcript_103586/g.223582  ORF Transcript_103586/g.223582 Transcript_103586/m.223582 type:complete len:110 (+) Transcript_103586:102-431(+)
MSNMKKTSLEFDRKSRSDKISKSMTKNEDSVVTNKFNAYADEGTEYYVISFDNLKEAVEADGTLLKKLYDYMNSNEEVKKNEVDYANNILHKIETHRDPGLILLKNGQL